MKCNMLRAEQLQHEIRRIRSSTDVTAVSMLAIGITYWIVKRRCFVCRGYIPSN